MRRAVALLTLLLLAGPVLPAIRFEDAASRLGADFRHHHGAAASCS
jgi:hypothetical protein